MTSIIHLKPPHKARPAHEIHVGHGMRKNIALITEALGSFDSVIILYDKSVEWIAKDIADQFAGATMIGVASGDASKSLAEVKRIVEAMLKARATRQSMLISVGGGMLTDLGGFIGSIFMRGIPFVHVPTSMLGMIDAAVGGKTGVNVGETKNIIGTISFPKAVIADTDFVTELPDELLHEGLVEAVKIAAIRSKEFFVWLEENIEHVLRRDPAALQHLIAMPIELKAKTVEEDDNDTLVRLLLNFGHTVAHAIEALSGYSLSHGKAVAIGMAAEMQMSNFKDAKRVNALLHTLGLSTDLPETHAADEIWAVMQSDKKNTKGDVRIAVPKILGQGMVMSIRKEQFFSLFT